VSEIALKDSSVKAASLFYTMTMSDSE